MELLDVTRAYPEEGYYLGREMDHVDRPQSAITNPFFPKFLYSPNDEEKIIQAYRRWLWQVISQGITGAESIANRFNIEVAYRWKQPSAKEVMDELYYLVENDTDLLCWNYEEGDLIRRAVNYLRQVEDETN